MHDNPDRKPGSTARSFLFATVAICALIPIQTGALADPNEHLEMFLDDVNIHSMTGAKRLLQNPTRLSNPIITGSGGSWDNDRSFGTVIFDEQDNIYKAWYQNNDAKNGVSYATSNDGLSWTYPDSPTKPGTNMLFRGESTIKSQQHGTYMKMYGASVIKDMNAPSAERYKMLYYDHDNGRGKMTVDNTPDGTGTIGVDYLYYDGTHYNGGSAGLYTATSSDGLNWTRSTTPQLDVFRLTEASIHDVAELMYDSQADKYVIYSKTMAQTSQATGSTVANANDHRIITRSESSDFVNWSTPQAVLRHANTEIDPQSYGSSVFEYEGMYIMPLRIYHNTGREDGQQGNRTIDVQLAASRDGVNWTRVADMGTFMGLGPSGSWDDGMVLPFRPFEKDGTINFYYQAWNGPHENPGDNAPVSRDGTIGLRQLDAGRFVSLTRDTSDTNHTKGTIITKTFVMDGDGLYINADLEDVSQIRVNVMNASYQSTGWTAYLTGDITATSNPLFYSVMFDGGTQSLADLFDGQTIALRFTLYGNIGDTELFGYTTSSAVAGLGSSMMVAVPEPTTATLVLMGVGCFLLRRRQPRGGLAG